MGKYESPEYRVKEKEGAFEIREYQEYYVVKYKENEDPMNSGGFQTLFRLYSVIFPRIMKKRPKSA